MLMLFVSPAPVSTTLAGSQVTRDGLSMSLVPCPLYRQVRGIDPIDATLANTHLHPFITRVSRFYHVYRIIVGGNGSSTPSCFEMPPFCGFSHHGIDCWQHLLLIAIDLVWWLTLQKKTFNTTCFFWNKHLVFFWTTPIFTFRFKEI